MYMYFVKMLFLNNNMLFNVQRHCGFCKFVRLQPCLICEFKNNINKYSVILFPRRYVTVAINNRALQDVRRV